MYRTRYFNNVLRIYGFRSKPNPNNEMLYIVNLLLLFRIDRYDQK